MTVIQNTAGNMIKENFYPILNVMAEVEELKCYQEKVPIKGWKKRKRILKMSKCYNWEIKNHLKNPNLLGIWQAEFWCVVMI